MDWPSLEIKNAMSIRCINKQHGIADWQIIQDSLTLIKVCLVETTGGGLDEINGPYPQEEAYRLCLKIEEILKLNVRIEIEEKHLEARKDLYR